jgi:hypothetical protein
MEVLGKEVPTSVIVVLLVISGLGATAGAATTGVIEGESTTDVNQALLVNESSSGFSGANGGVFQVGDGNSSFVTGASVNQGDTYTIEVALDNAADSDISARLVIDNPTPLHVDAGSPGDDIEVQRVGANEFILEVADNTGNEDIDLTVTAPNNVNPGFYTFETTIAPIDIGDEVRE